MIQMNLQYRKRLTDFKDKFMVAGGKMRARDREFGMGMYTLLYFKWITHSSILTWEILWTEEPGRLQSIGSQRVRQDLATEHACTF